jgi:hypothetical protein
MAVNHLRLAVHLHRGHSSPLELAHSEHNLGSALFHRTWTFPGRPASTREAEMEEALDLFGQALTSRTLSEHPLQWAMTQMMLALIYAYRLKGDRKKNLEHSLGVLEETLQQVDIAQEYPIGCAKDFHHLGPGIP